MISQSTAERIWTAYREIAVSEKLLADMAEERERLDRDGQRNNPAKLKDAFGRRKSLTLGVPSGDDSMRIFDVSEKLAESVIRAHIAQKRQQLAEANEQARIELDTAQIEPGETIDGVGTARVAE